MDTCESQSGSLDQSPAQTSPSIDQTLPGIGGLYPQLSRLFRSSTHSPRLVDRPHLRLRQLVSNSLLDRDLFKGSPFAVLLTVGSPICPICPHVGQLAPTQIRIVTNGIQVVTNDVQVVTNGPQVVTNGPQVVTNEGQVVTNS